MLLLVIFNINNSSCIQTQTTITKQCESSLSSKLQHWFSELKPRFAQLALCHGVLAKVPHSLLLETEAEGRPLLVTLFPKICKLFDRCAKFVEYDLKLIALKLQLKNITEIFSPVHMQLH